MSFDCFGITLFPMNHRTPLKTKTPTSQAVVPSVVGESRRSTWKTSNTRNSTTPERNTFTFILSVGSWYSQHLNLWTRHEKRFTKSRLITVQELERKEKILKSYLSCLLFNHDFISCEYRSD